MEDQQKLEELVNEINMYKQQADLIQQQIEMIRASLTEVEILDKTLDDLEEKETVEAFVPLGAGSFMRGEIKNTKEVIMSIGGGVAVAKDIAGAKDTISNQKKDLQDSLDKMMSNLQQVTNVVENLSPQAEQLMSKMRMQQS